jgi:hypothetical protein
MPYPGVSGSKLNILKRREMDCAKHSTEEEQRRAKSNCSKKGFQIGSDLGDLIRETDEPSPISLQV